MNVKVCITEDKLIIGDLELLHKQARDNCRCTECWNPSLQQRRKNPPCHAITVTECHLEDGEDGEEGSVARVKWSDDHQGWLQLPRANDRSLSCKSTVEELRSGELLVWKHSLDSMTFKFEYSNLLNSAEEQYNLLQTFMKRGIVQICNAPLEDAANPGLQKIAESLGLGPPVSTLFGPFFNVKSKPSSDQLKNQAYTNLPLPLHTDLPFYDFPPEVFLFGCVKPSSSGGESIYMDGIAAAEQLRDENLEYFKVLSTVPMIHRDDTAAWQMVSMQPLIQLNENGTVYRIVDNPACRDSNQYWTPPAIWFEAYGAFRSIVEDSSHHFVYPMVSGDITIFDNWRVYHGRQGFPDQGEEQSRFMTGMYCTRTHLNSAVRLLEARLMATDSAVASS